MTLNIKQNPSPNFNDRKSMPLDMIIMHYTGMKTAKEALDKMCDARAEVSAHYMIDEDGTVYQLVDEQKRAWHAGVSNWAGRNDINSHSIGIELVNPGHEWGYRAFPKAQINTLIALCRGICARHDILPEYILGHEDIAPQRKQDPGELFPWQELAQKHGIGIWPHPKA